VVGNAGRLHLSNDDGVIPARVNMNNAAFNISESTLKKWRPLKTTTIHSAFKAIFVPRSKPLRDALLMVG
jgi:hypothetical protein